ncbi:MAG: hypothetical protein JW892_16805 [Anaerolineae bacterium]|nr:hypothetical protein [Anaerolineae bacterium]
MQKLERVIRLMDAGRTDRAKVVIVGQRGTGKSMDLAWIAAQLSRTHLVVWLDAVGLDSTVLQDPLNLFAVMGLGLAQGAITFGEQPDRQYLQNLLCACWDTFFLESTSEKKEGVNLDKIFSNLGRAISSLILPLSATAALTARPVFMVAVGTLTLLMQAVTEGVEADIGEQETYQRTRTEPPRVSAAAARLHLFAQDVEQRTGRPVVVIIDGLDRVARKDIQALCQRSKDLACPDLRLILTAPLTLYQAPEFRELEEFFPEVVTVPNARCEGPESPGYDFLHRILTRRLELCNLEEDEVFVPEVASRLLLASGGNIRQLILLAHGALLNTECRGQAQIDATAADGAIGSAMTALVERAMQRPQLLTAVQTFARAERPLPPDGEVGDFLLETKCILAYQDMKGRLAYALHPLARAYLQEEGLI